MRIKNIEQQRFAREMCVSVKMYNINFYKFYFDINFIAKFSCFPFFLQYIHFTNRGRSFHSKRDLYKALLPVNN